MGQYHKVFNLTKKEALHPHKFNDGLKLLEFGASGNGTMCGLAILLAASCKGGVRGGCDSELAGRWAGDCIAIVGDYAETDDVPGHDAKAIYGMDGFKDISSEVYAAVVANVGKRGDSGRLAPDMIISGGKVLTGREASDAMKE